MQHGGGEGRLACDEEQPEGFDLLDSHIEAICAGVYGNRDYFPPQVDTLAKQRAYVLKESPGILDALKDAYNDRETSFLPDAVAGEGLHQGMLAPRQKGISA